VPPIISHTPLFVYVSCFDFGFLVTLASDPCPYTLLHYAPVPGSFASISTFLWVCDPDRLCTASLGMEAVGGLGYSL
jgi:hypothetical protein